MALSNRVVYYWSSGLRYLNENAAEAPITSGAKFPEPGWMMAMPMVNTRKKVPSSSTMSFLIVALAMKILY